MILDLRVETLVLEIEIHVLNILNVRITYCEENHNFIGSNTTRLAKYLAHCNRDSKTASSAASTPTTPTAGNFPSAVDESIITLSVEANRVAELKEFLRSVSSPDTNNNARVVILDNLQHAGTLDEVNLTFLSIAIS